MSSELLQTENVRRDKLEIVQLIIVLNTCIEQLLENTMHCRDSLASYGDVLKEFPSCIFSP